MRFLMISIYVVLVFIFDVGSSRAEQNPAELRLVQEYKQALEQMGATDGDVSVRGTFRKRTRIGTPSEEVTSGTFFCSRTQSSIKLESSIDSFQKKDQPELDLPLDSSKRKMKATVLSVNDEYSFRLFREGESQDYFIDYLNKERAPVFSPIRRFFQRTIDCSRTAQGFGILNYLKLETTVVEHAETIPSNDGEKLIKFNFKMNSANTTPTNPRSAKLERGELIVAPEQGWVLREYKLLFRQPSGSYYSNRGKIEYGKKSAAHYAPTKILHQVFLEPKKKSDDPGGETVEQMTEEDSCEISSYQDRGESLAAFQVSYYGFPEVGVAKRSRSGWFIVAGCLVVALACVGLAIAIRRVNRKTTLE